jgi:hypothetical protein
MRLKPLGPACRRLVFRGGGAIKAMVVLGMLSLGCDDGRYEIRMGSGDVAGMIVYRLDRKTGEVCAFRLPLGAEPRGVLVGIGCAGRQQ